MLSDSRLLLLYILYRLVVVVYNYKFFILYLVKTIGIRSKPITNLVYINKNNNNNNKIKLSYITHSIFFLHLYKLHNFSYLKFTLNNTN